MKVNVLNTISAFDIYEIQKIEIIPESPEEKEEIFNVSEPVQNTLIHRFRVISILESNPPFFIVKRHKQNLGFGG